MWFPDIKDPDFYNKLYSKEEFNENIKSKEGVYQKPYQQFVRKFINQNTPYDSLLLYWNMGTGKCLKKDTEVLMYDGSIKKVQDIRIGEFVMGDDSAPRKVLTLSRGESEMYDIIPKKGDKYTVNDEHIISLYYSPNKSCVQVKHGKYDYYRVMWFENRKIMKKMFPLDKKEEALELLEKVNHEKYIDISIKDYLKLPKPISIHLKGYKVKVDFPEKELPFDPYMIGYWLGDGSSNVPNITTQDSTVLHYFNENVFLNTLKDCNLINNKHIPEIYKRNSRKNRLKLLAGLIDSDGYFDKKNGGFEFSQKNEIIMNDVIYLCRSLGFSCYKANKNTTWTYKGVKNKGTSWRICINGEGIEEIPTLIPRKQAIPRKQVKNALVSHIRVEPVGKGEYFGFSLDGNHRFLLGDFTVTHNSLGSVSILENFRNLVGADGGLEKFLIITKNETLRNVFRDEILKEPYENPYGTDRDREKIKKNDTNTLKIVKNRISNKYEFINYDEFVNRVLGKNTKKNKANDSNKKREENIRNFDNRIIIIDEVQNVTGNFRYIALMRTLQKAKNVRLIILSATPIVDTVEEIIYISNLLNFKDPKFVLKDSSLEISQESDEKLKKNMKYFYNEGILKLSNPVKDKKNLLSFNNITEFTKKGEDILIDSLKGRISHVPSDPSSFPVKIKRGEPMEKNKKGSVWVVKCPMSEHQEKAYEYALTLNSNFHSKSSDALTMSYNASNEKDYIDRSYINKTPLKFTQIGQYSSKIHCILKNIQESKGCVFIYSNLVVNSGTDLIETVLKANGYTPYTNNRNLSNKGKVYVKYSENLSNTERTAIQNAINSKSNIDGSSIKIIIGSPMVSEGVSFKNIRQVHILEPHWNMARTLQAEGRCIRNDSHIDLPIEERNVNTFWYVATSKKGPTIDELKYILSEEKDRSNKKVERILKEISIDCYNLKKIGNKKNIYEDFSSECDYQKCEYNCKFIDESKISKIKDGDTYSSLTDPQEIKWAKDLIKNFFIRSPVWDIETMIKEIKDLGLNKNNLFFALDDMLKKQIRFFVKGKGNGYIIYTDKYYRFKLDKQKTDFQIKTIEEFKRSIDETPVRKKIVKKNIGTGENKNRINKLEIFSSKVKSDVFGYIENGSFKIVDMRNQNSRLTDKGKKRGLTCTSFQRATLIDLAAYIGIKINKGVTIPNICLSIRDKLSKDGLMFEL